MALEKAVIPDSTNFCREYDELKKKCEKVVGTRNALCQAVKLLEQGFKKLEFENVKLKKGIQEEQAQRKIGIERKLKISNALAAFENEVSALKSETAALQQKCDAGAREGNSDVEVLKACISDTEKEIYSLKELVEKENIVADYERKTAEEERKKAAEEQKLFEAQKKVSSEIEKQIVKVEAEKAEEHRLRQVQLEKEVNETKMKLASELSKIKETTTRFEAEKRKLLVEKRNAESEMRKAQDRVEIEKQQVEEQKKVAEDNWRRAVEAERLADQMSQKLAEDKQTIEELNQKIHELSSLRKSNEMSGVSPDVCVNADSNKLQLLGNSLQLEKLQAKHTREKIKRERMKAEHEASRRSMLEHELRDLKRGYNQVFNQLGLTQNEVSSLNSEIAALQQKCGAGAREGNGDMEVLKACISDMEKEINSLKELVEKEKIIADSERKTAEDERKKAAEVQRLLEAQKKISAEIEKQIAKVKAEKAEEQRLRQFQLEKEVNETKMKLASEVSKIEEATKLFEAEKQKLLVEKIYAESEMRTAQDRVEAEKKKADMEKQQAEEEKKFAEKRAVEAEGLANQMSQKLAEDKKTIEDLKRKIHDISSLRKSDEMSGVPLDVCVNADSKKLQLLEYSLQLEKLHGKLAREKFKRERMMAEHEACRHSILEHELHNLKRGQIKYFNQLGLTKETGALQVTTLTKLVEENFNARSSMLNPSGRSIIEHDRMRKRIHDTVECNANLSSEGQKINMQLANLLCGEMDNVEFKSDRTHKKRKESHWAKADTSLSEKKETKEMKGGVSEDANGCKHYTCPASYTATSQACRERMQMAANTNALNNFDEMGDGNVMKLLDLENVADEECFRKTIDEPLSPFLPEIGMFVMDNLKVFLEEALHEDLLSPRDSVPSTGFDVIDVEIHSNKKKIDGFSVPLNTSSINTLRCN